MPTILRSEGFEFVVFPNDHLPAHVHVFRGDDMAIIDISTEKPQLHRVFGMKKGDVKRALRNASENLETLAMAGGIFMDRDFDKAYDLAVARGKADEPRATAVRYNMRTRRIDVELANGMSISVPTRQIEGLHDATVSQLKEGRVRGRGMALRWDSLDADVSVPELFQGVLGSRRWMSELGRAGGRVKSAQKAKAARDNGKKGGRPRKGKAAEPSQKRT